MKASEISKYYGDQESTAHRQKRSKATKTKAGEVAHTNNDERTQTAKHRRRGVNKLYYHEQLHTISIFTSNNQTDR